MLHRNIKRLAALGSVACCVASASAAFAGTWSQRTVAGMTVQVYVPTSAGSYAGGRGLMLGLHGCTQQATALRDRGNWEPAADRFGVVIALPQVPNGGVLAGCWDYYGGNHTRTTRHEGPVLQLVTALLADAALGIDDAQVYVSGLSSGGGEAMVLGCLAPDVFAGVGINAGPAVGTASSEISRVATTEAAATTLCRRLAGTSASAFDTQLTSVAYGTSDYVVAQGYGRLDAEVMASLYGAAVEAPLDVTALPGFMPRGTGTTWSDARGVRVQMITVQGMGHAFPAGSGDSFEMSFIAARGPAWPMVMLELFTSGNRRVSGGPVTPADAGVPPRTDAGTVTPGPDASTPTPVPDAGVIPVPGRDASTSPPRADASTAPVADGGLSPGDAGTGDGSADPEDPVDGGCTTAGVRDPALVLLLALAALGLVRRRKP